MIQLTLTGNVGRDARIVEKDNATPFCTFTIAVDDGYTNKEGTKVDRTIWVECIINDAKKAIIPYIKTGQKMLVQGKPSAHAYLDKDKNPQASLRINTTYCELLGKAQEKAPATVDTTKTVDATSANPADAANPNNVETTDDLPF